MRRRLTGMLERRALTAATVVALIIAYAALYSWLAILRHRTFGSAAMDLGYTDQVVWNTLHGRPFLFSTYQNAPIDLPLEEFRRTDNLLGYHVELILLPISLLYLIYSSPITLLVLQAVVIATGAWPAFLLARQHLRSDFAGLAFSLAYLMSPALQGAALSDFHGVSMCASLLLFALYFALTGRGVPLLLTVTLSMLCREDISALTFMLGLYILVVLKERRLGLSVALLSLAWLFACTRIVLPHFSGLALSPFVQRLAVFGPTVKDSLHSALADPMQVVRWLTTPEILTYLLGMGATGGFLSIFAPQLLVLSLPVLVVNVLSSWSWTYSEGAHYSASIVPFVIASAIYGLGVLSSTLQRRLRLPPGCAVVLLSVWLLIVSGLHHYWVGVSPIARTWYPPKVDEHDHLGERLLARIPTQSPVSAQSNLYPHVAQREKAYLFPAVNDAQYVLLDVTSPAYPLTVSDLHHEALQLLRSAEFGVLVAQDGYLFLERGLAPVDSLRMPDSFYTFVRADESEVAHRLRAMFGGSLELLGYDVHLLNLVHAQQLPAQVRTYWRVLSAPNMDYEFQWSFTRGDGAIVAQYGEETPTTSWLPPSMWQAGQIVEMETPILNVGRLRDALLAVSLPGADPGVVENRLPILLVEAPAAELRGEGTLLAVFRFP